MHARRRIQIMMLLVSIAGMIHLGVMISQSRLYTLRLETQFSIHSQRVRNPHRKDVWDQRVRNPHRKDVWDQRVRNPHRKDVWDPFDHDCSLAIANVSKANKLLERYAGYQNNSHNKIQKTFTNCSEFASHLASFASVTQTERDFPIAFSILVYKDPEQSIRLLRAIWRPQNYYCIHMDVKSNFDILLYIMVRVRCLSNVILAPRMVNVVWGTFTVLEADLICMDALFNHTAKWKYFINLTGQEFPLKTNYELVRILQLYAGGNDIFGQLNKVNPKRLKHLGPPPHGIKPAKGPVHVVASRAFIDYTLHNQIAIDFLQWVRKMKVPDETYFTSLNLNTHLQVPGSFTGTLDKKRHHNFYLDSKTRYKIFVYDKTYPKCHGRSRNSVCLFGVEDLHLLTNSSHLFVNKFKYNFQPVAYDCLENWLVKKIESEKQGHLDFDLSPYQNIYFLNNCHCK